MRDAALQVIACAKRELNIASAQLEPALFADAQLIEALKQQLLTERRLKLRLLISKPRVARRHADRLLGLARRLPSQFAWRQPSRPEHSFEHDLWVADRKAYVIRKSVSALYARFGPNSPLESKNLKDEFEQTWQHALPSTEFRQLHC